MGYQYDIFISYRRQPETLTWIREHFLPLLDHWVGLELGRDPSVFVHEISQRIAPGAHWPAALNDCLVASRVLIALWTKNYFTSRWCASEFAHMLAREQSRSGRAGDGDRSFGL